MPRVDQPKECPCLWRNLRGCVFGVEIQGAIRRSEAGLRPVPQNRVVPDDKTMRKMSFVSQKDFFPETKETS